MPKFVKQQTFHGGFHLVGYYRGSSNVALGNPFQTRDFPQVVVAPPPGEGKSTTVLWRIAAHGFDWAEGPTGPVQVYAQVKNVAQCRSLVDYARSSPLAKNITANAQIAYATYPRAKEVCSILWQRHALTQQRVPSCDLLWQQPGNGQRAKCSLSWL